MEHSSYYYTGLHVIASIVTAAKMFRNVMVVNTYTIINACTTEVRKEQDDDLPGMQMYSRESSTQALRPFSFSLGW